MVSVCFSKERSVQDYYSSALNEVDHKNWKTAVTFCEKIVRLFPDSPFSSEALYYAGICYFELDDYSLANRYFTDYLKQKKIPKYFDQSIEYKFKIAEKYRNGSFRRMFHFKHAPKFSPAKKDALDLYEEVISTLPYHDLAAKSFFGKALIQRQREDYRESIETFHQLIRRFPKHELSIASFIEIGKTYLNQCNRKKLDPEIIHLAQLNLEKFQIAFPGEDRVEEAKQNVLLIKEKFANSLFETGRFFEKRKKVHAAKIYYQRVIHLFPDTKSAFLCKNRIEKLKNS